MDKLELIREKLEGMLRACQSADGWEDGETFYKETCAGVKESTKEALSLLSEYEKESGWSVWPEEAPEIGSHVEIYLPERRHNGDKGHQFSRFDRDNSQEEPYFYWCGHPTKVWWRYVQSPTPPQEES